MASIGDFVDKEQVEVPTLLEPEQPEPEVIEHRGIDLGFLKAETGPGSVESYIDHALNFNRSRGVARMIRGLTGMLGSLNYAIVDIAIGFLDVLKDRRREVPSIDSAGH